MISGNMVGMYSTIGKTLVLTDDSGNEVTGVIVGQEVVFTAGDNDVREGMVYASDDGVSTGTKVIPAYHTTEAVKLIPSGSSFSIQLENLDKYDYTKFQAIICPYNSSLSMSVAAEKVSINDSVYAANSTELLYTVVKNSSDKTIDLGFTNDSGSPYVIRFFTYKEIE